MNLPDTIYFSGAQSWREWLEYNHDSQSLVWLLYYKKHTARPKISYDEAVEEAICFGWIDSVVKGIDEISYCQKFTPRKNGSKWSQSNIKRAEEMIKQGKMTPAGLKLYQEVIDNPDLIIESLDNSRDIDLPEELREEFKSNPDGAGFFFSASRSYRNMCIRWIASAKRDETIKRRVKEVVELSNKKQKIGLK